MFENNNLVKISIFDIGIRTETEEKSYEFAREIGLLPIIDFCNDCKIEAKEIKKNNSFMFQCTKCFKRWSVFRNTMFFNSKTTLSNILRLLYCFSIRMRNKETQGLTGISNKTVSKWFGIFKTVCMEAYNCTHRKKIGGFKKTVEIDETYLFKRKSHKGRLLISQSVWLVGGICRETGEVFVTLTEKRDKETLTEMILNSVEPGTKIITDCWGGYNELNKFFEHKKINHKYNFVDPNDKTINTQKIERFWRTIKTFIKNNTSQKYKLKNIINCLYEEMNKKIELVKKFHLFLLYMNYLMNFDVEIDNLMDE